MHSGGGQTVLSVVTNRDAADVHVMLLRRAGSAVLFDQPIALLGAGQVYQSPPISTPGLGGADVAVQVTSGGILLGEY